jgi:hypothetical protein
VILPKTYESAKISGLDTAQEPLPELTVDVGNDLNNTPHNEFPQVEDAPQVHAEAPTLIITPQPASSEVVPPSALVPSVDQGFCLSGCQGAQYQESYKPSFNGKKYSFAVTELGWTFIDGLENSFNPNVQYCLWNSCW